VLIIASALAVYFGVLWLGLSYDDFSNLESYRTHPMAGIARQLQFNRSPLFGLLVYPALLALPVGLAHALVIAAHTGAALMLRRVLMQLDLSDRTATLAGLVFLVWPAHAEVLYWLAASTQAFGMGLMLASTGMLLRGRRGLALFAGFLGTLFSEAILIPTFFLHGLSLVRRRQRALSSLAQLAALAVLYAGFQALRRALSYPGSIAQYEVGLTKVVPNVVQVLSMSMGLVSSRPVSWLWTGTARLFDVTLSAPWVTFVAALGLALLVVRSIAALPAATLEGRRLVLAAGIAGVGYLSSLVVFAVVVGNDMQNRYTYVPVLFLAALVGILLGEGQGSRVGRPLTLAIAVGVVSASVYRDWSVIWANWYPARLVNDRVIADTRVAISQVNAKRVYIVNAPRVVGSGYTITQDWAYLSVGRLFVAPQIEMRGDYLFTEVKYEIRPGVQFSDQPCVFVGWRGGRMEVTRRAYDHEHDVLLNCETGQIEQAPPDAASTVLTIRRDEPSRERLGQFPALATPWRSEGESR
jgi:hypothetical protein